MKNEGILYQKIPTLFIFHYSFFISYLGLITIPFPLLVRSHHFALSKTLYCRAYCTTLKIVVVVIYNPTPVCIVYTNEPIINTIKIFINHIILPISGAFCPGIFGVSGLASVVSLVWKQVNIAAMIVSAIFLVHNKSIPRKCVLITQFLRTFGSTKRAPKLWKKLYSHSCGIVAAAICLIT